MAQTLANVTWLISIVRSSWLQTSSVFTHRTPMSLAYSTRARELRCSHRTPVLSENSIFPTMLRRPTTQATSFFVPVTRTYLLSLDTRRCLTWYMATQSSKCGRLPLEHPRQPCQGCIQRRRPHLQLPAQCDIQRRSHRVPRYILRQDLQRARHCHSARDV